jgi:hypothetical protein
LTLITSIILAASSGAPTAEAAAVLAARGETTEARRMLGPLMSPAPNSAALFVMVCVELEEGHIDAATEAMARLAAMEPKRPEVQVLDRIVEERRRAPRDRWTDVAARAWKAAGRPQSGEKPLIAPIEVERPLDASAIARLKESSDRFLLETAKADRKADLVDAAIAEGRADNQRVAVQLVALHVLRDPNLQELRRSQARAAALDLLTRMAKAHPEDGYLAVGEALGDLDPAAPLSEHEISRLEEAVKKAEFGLPMRPLFVAFRDALNRVDPGQAHALAFSQAVWSLPLEFHATLSRRVSATTDPTLSRRAAAVLAAVGSRFGARPSSLERSVGVAMEEKAAKLRGDAAGATAAAEKRRALQAVMSVAGGFSSYPWAIASLMRDQFERNSVDEVGYFEALSK